jgi:hypothetical protein
MMRSSSILDIISTANTFNTTPADIFGVPEEETYLRFCINDACNYLWHRIQPDMNGKQELPVFDDERVQSKSHNPGLELLMKGIK